MKKKVIQIGGNLRINGISSFIMTLYRNLQDEYQFIFINTAEGKDHYRAEIEAMGGKGIRCYCQREGTYKSVKAGKRNSEYYS